MMLQTQEVGWNVSPRFLSVCQPKGGHMAKAGTDQQVLEALEAKAADHGVDIVAVEVVGATKNPW